MNAFMREVKIFVKVFGKVEETIEGFSNSVMIVCDFVSVRCKGCYGIFYAFKMFFSLNNFFFLYFSILEVYAQDKEGEFRLDFQFM